MRDEFLRYTPVYGSYPAYRLLSQEELNHLGEPMEISDCLGRFAAGSSTHWFLLPPPKRRRGHLGSAVMA